MVNMEISLITNVITVTLIAKFVMDLIQINALRAKITPIITNLIINVMYIAQLDTLSTRTLLHVLSVLGTVLHVLI